MWMLRELQHTGGCAYSDLVRSLDVVGEIEEERAEVLSEEQIKVMVDEQVHTST